MLHGGKPVRDAKGGAPLHQLVKGHLDDALGFVVQRTGRFVQDQDRRVLQYGAGDGNALALAAGEVGAFLAHDGVIALRLAHYEFVGESVAGGLLYLGICRARAAQADVVADGVVEQDDFLGDDRHLGANIPHGGLAQVHASDADGAPGRIVKSQKEVGQGGFARTAFAHQGDHLARLRRKTDVAQYQLVLVSEADIVK